MKMNCNISFQERAKLAGEALSKQLPVTIEEARKQVERIKQRIAHENRKQRPLEAEDNCSNYTTYM